MEQHPIIAEALKFGFDRVLVELNHDGYMIFEMSGVEVLRKPKYEVEEFWMKLIQDSDESGFPKDSTERFRNFLMIKE